MKKYDKLVRDGIPKIIELQGNTPTFHIATKDEFYKKLKEKLIEEAEEFFESGRVEELGDVLEVVYTICETKGIDMEKVEEERKKKYLKRGGFDNKIILDKVE